VAIVAIHDQAHFVAADVVAVQVTERALDGLERGELVGGDEQDLIGDLCLAEIESP
jgi:hypothetical protein